MTVYTGIILVEFYSEQGVVLWQNCGLLNLLNGTCHTFSIECGLLFTISATIHQQGKLTQALVKESQSRIASHERKKK